MLGGDAGLSPRIQRRLLDHLSRPAPDPAPASLPDNLTAREAEVLARIADGVTNPEIARALHVSPATVKTHIDNLFAKTGVKNRAQTECYAYQQDLTVPPRA